MGAENKDKQHKVVSYRAWDETDGLFLEEWIENEHLKFNFLFFWFVCFSGFSAGRFSRIPDGDGHWDDRMSGDEGWRRIATYWRCEGREEVRSQQLGCHQYESETVKLNFEEWREGEDPQLNYQLP